MTARFLTMIDLPESGLALLREAGEVTRGEDVGGNAALPELAASGDYDVIVCALDQTFDAATLEKAQLQGIANYAVGYNNIDIPAATAAGIRVGNTPEVLTAATADIALLLILGVTRRAYEGERMMRAGQFTGWAPDLLVGKDVAGATLGLAGFGRIGRAVAERALAFGMQVVFAPRPPAHRDVSAAELGDLAGRVEQVRWEEMVERADILSLHVPLTEDTRHLVDADVLARMKRGSVLINTARGPVVDESALVEALRSGHLFGAGLDVFEDEPAMAAGLAELDNVMVLPHLGSATRNTRDEMAVLTARNAIAMATGGDIPACVNPA
ncbi:D-glycerate dehydrogenase [Micrococcus sp. FDAARGOS_333]|uniref:2-hydroxyacid dehydrogenase n=1 Tax=Micrococcus sp. FDAARGOS_333 TaxID=1930558 RepID=UPI000B4E101C|nr:D-glycerate dehydrogenase [Micrococcus sp. FDAARGOS_333]PNL17133.1 D-glycerate dehydrogenase [Micrococcus sp. FDAARGOS_333]